MSKYRNIKTDGYASKREARRAQELKLLERIGDISELREQVPFELLPSMSRADGSKERSTKYIADFVYEENGAQIVEDCKGCKTDVYILKRKMMLFLHGITIRES